MKSVLFILWSLLLWTTNTFGQDVIQADLFQSESTVTVTLDESDTGCNYYLTYAGNLQNTSSYAANLLLNGEEVHYSRTTDASRKIITITIYHDQGVSGDLELEVLIFNGSGSGIQDIVEW
ncbi:MAG: hypothetical protein H6581_25380 [Bacteroidia bacterium]|nr:hypothetical protein [Bacteroidia bacterium]